jgi:hypothetical protein
MITLLITKATSHNLPNMKLCLSLPIIAAWIAVAVALLGNSARAFAPLPQRDGRTAASQPTAWLRATSEQSAAVEAERLKEKARLLREEIETFEKEKDSLEDEERREIQAEFDSKQAWIDQYSAVVPILKPDGSTVEEKVQFPPRLEGNESSILVLEAPLPLGIVLGEDQTIPGMTCVDEVSEGSNGQLAGFQVGDLVRACTACRVEMETPTWQLMAGGIGRPKTMRFMFSCDFKPFEQVMEGLGSNRMDPEERSILVVVERQTKK